MPDETIAIIGSGGIGGFLAAELAGAGRDVTLCVRTPFDRLTIEEAGATREVPVRVATRPDQARPASWILVTTKAQDTASTAPWLMALVRPATTIVVVQNGLDQAERVRPFAGEAAILPAIIYCSVERVAPGRIVHHSAARLIVPEGNPAFAALFQGTAFEVVQDPDFRTAAWRKLFGNVAANPITALTLRRVRIFGDAGIQALASDLLAEALQVAQADGAGLTQADVDGVVSGMGKINPEGGTSMLYDRLAGRPLEHAYITGAVVAAATRHGIDVPLNRAMLALLGVASGQRLDGRA